MRHLILALGLALAALAAPAATIAQAPGGAALVAAQIEAMTKLAAMDGEWRGEAVTETPTGIHRVTHTERVGTLLGGSIRLVEGHAYRADGSTGFNAFAAISFDPPSGKYHLSSFADGRAGKFELTPTADGYAWQIAAGPMTIRYNATIKDGRWVETGERVTPGQPPVQFFRMELKRIGESQWPAGNPVGMR